MFDFFLIQLHIVVVVFQYFILGAVWSHRPIFSTRTATTFMHPLRLLSWNSGCCRLLFMPCLQIVYKTKCNYLKYWHRGRALTRVFKLIDLWLIGKICSIVDLFSSYRPPDKSV